MSTISNRSDALSIIGLCKAIGENVFHPDEEMEKAIYAEKHVLSVDELPIGSRNAAADQKFDRFRRAYLRVKACATRLQRFCPERQATMALAEAHLNACHGRHIDREFLVAEVQCRNLDDDELYQRFNREFCLAFRDLFQEAEINNAISRQVNTLIELVGKFKEEYGRLKTGGDLCRDWRTWVYRTANPVLVRLFDEAKERY